MKVNQELEFWWNCCYWSSTSFGVSGVATAPHGQAKGWKSESRRKFAYPARETATGFWARLQHFPCVGWYGKYMYVTILDGRLIACIAAERRTTGCLY